MDESFRKRKKRVRLEKTKSEVNKEWICLNVLKTEDL